jgi:hypothetical protein
MNLRRPIIALALLAALLSSYAGQSQEPPKQTPEVKAGQQSNSGLKAQPTTEGNTQPATPSPASVPEVLPGGHDGTCSGQCPNAGQEGTEFWPPLFGYRLKITDTLLVGFTALLFIATLALWWSTRRLVTGADRTAERQLRAYVMVNAIGIKNLIVGGKPEATINIKNSGQTPASEMTHWARIAFSTFPVPGNIPGAEQNVVLPPGTLAPGGERQVTVVMEQPLTAATLAALQNQSYALYVVGEIRYLDAFGKIRETDFMAFCTGPLVDAGTMASFRTGNRIT